MTSFLVQRVRQALLRPRGVRDLVRNVALDLRYGGHLLGGVVESEYGSIGYIGTENSPYDAFPRLFAAASLTPDDVIVDVGCGRGRLMNWLLHEGITNRAIGIEVSRRVAAATRRRLRRYPQLSIVSGDVKDEFPEQGTVFYLYNPFGADTMAWFADRLEPLRARGGGRRPIVLYFNSLHLAPFAARGWHIHAIDLGGVSDLPAALVTPS